VRSSDGKKIFQDIEKSIERAVDTFFEELNTVAKSKTPVDTGRASRGWRYTRRYTVGYAGTLIENTVGYIGLLDRGSSRQAPAGITVPAIREVLSKRPRKI
jgi:hypothetical protein